VGAEPTDSLRRRLRRSARRLGRRIDLGRLASRREDGSPLGLRTAKATLAAVISWELALRLPGSQPPVLAPLTALLVTQVTVVQTITGSFQRVASVTAGLLVALGVADLLGLHWWSIGLVIFVSLALGQVLRLGSHRMEVPISALLATLVVRIARLAVQIMTRELRCCSPGTSPGCRARPRRCPGGRQPCPFPRGTPSRTPR
jgi:uncharacterized membrane protein YccC